MKKTKQVIFFINVLINLYLLTACNDCGAGKKQAELDKNKALWRSKSINHYRFTDNPTIFVDYYLSPLFSAPRTIYVSNNQVYSITIETNNYTKEELIMLTNDYLWTDIFYLDSNVIKFVSPVGYTIEDYFNEIQSTIDDTVNRDLDCQYYTIDVAYDQEYGYPFRMRLTSGVPAVADSSSPSPWISNFQILN